MPKAALFDAGDTLVHWGVHKRERFVWLCEQAGVLLPADESLRLAAGRAADRFFYSQSGRADYWSDAWWTEQITAGLAELGLSPELAVKVQAHRAALPTTWWLDPDAIPVLQELRQRRYKIGLVSNWDGTLAASCVEWGLTEHVDYVGDSSVFGESKPSAAFFLHVLDSLGVSAQDAFHVGDHYDYDVKGARAAGITPILLDALGSEERSCEHRVASLLDVLDICDQL